MGAHQLMGWTLLQCLLPLLSVSAFCIPSPKNHVCANSHVRSRSSGMARSAASSSSSSFSSVELDLTQRTTTTTTTTTTLEESIELVRPNGSFRDTVAGEVSVASLNLLAPFYHWIGCDDAAERAEQDRRDRTPLSIRLATQTNADILCLQEVEGGETRLESLLEQELRKDCVNNKNVVVPGYDRHVWTPLYPDRRNDVVGLCVAWRSDKHMLVSTNCFRRGMVVQLEEIQTGARVSVANVHLPAKASAVRGRLQSLSTAIKALEGCERFRYRPGTSSSSSSSSLDGTVIVTGDFNCEPRSIVLNLLREGRIPHGTIRDRNYRARISKDLAYNTHHDYRFRNVYQAAPPMAAPVTVSLRGRRASCMDQLYYTNHKDKQQQHLQQDNARASSGRGRGGGGGRIHSRGSKRRARRERGQQLKEGNIGQYPSTMRIESVLATMDHERDPKRTEIILAGLPNVAEGFPSDHLPIGVLLVPDGNDTLMPTDEKKKNGNNMGDDNGNDYYYKSGGVSINSRRRRESYQQSLWTRRRHNAVLGIVADWLRLSGGASDMLQDEPLYQWKWIQKNAKLPNKQRAPDLCCVVSSSSPSSDNHNNNDQQQQQQQQQQQTLLVVEVTVSTNTDKARGEKQNKYWDLGSHLATSAPVVQTGLAVEDLVVVAVQEDGTIPLETTNDLRRLTRLCGFVDDDDKEVCRITDAIQEALQSG